MIGLLAGFIFGGLQFVGICVLVDLVLGLGVPWEVYATVYVGGSLTFGLVMFIGGVENVDNRRP